MRISYFANVVSKGRRLSLRSGSDGPKYTDWEETTLRDSCAGGTRSVLYFLLPAEMESMDHARE